MNDSDFEKIFHLTKRAVLGAVNRYLSRRFLSAADDVVQESYLRAYKRLTKSDITDMDRICSYMYTIAKNECFRMNEKLSRDEAKARKLMDGQRWHNPDSIEREAEKSSMNDFLNSKLKTLPGKYSQVLELYSAGLDNKEIAARLDLKGATVKTRLFRGLRLLRGAVSQE